MTTDIYTELSWRGLVYQTTDDAFLAGWLRTPGRTVYAGFDPTADSLHVGHLMPLMLLRRFQRAGHRPIALAGGATGMIGDPSGKSAERNLLSPEKLAANVASIEGQLRHLLDFDAGKYSAVLTNNLEWIGKFSFIEFLRDVGKNFPVNVMMGKDSIKSRLTGDTGISYTEFSYMLLQAYDFVHLRRAYGCELQVGGSDQWGNITAGIDLARRMDAVQLYGLTCPLLMTADGQKMGKTEKGALWLSPQRTSPYAFYQYWINVADADAGKCLRFLTDCSSDEIEALLQAQADRPQERPAQHRLAASVTGLIHGPAGLEAAERATKIFFGAAIANLSDAQLAEIFADVPSRELPRARLDEGLPVIDAFMEAALAKSKGEVRRKLDEGGVYVNNVRCTDKDQKLGPADLASETVLVLRLGRKNYALLRFV